MIEARVVLADEVFGRTLGVRLGVQGRTSTQPGQTGVRAGISSTIGDSSGPAGSTAALTTPPGISNVDLGASLTAGSTVIGTTASSIGFTLINAASTGVLGLELQALEADRRGKIISNPRVVTQNQRPAVILTGKQIPNVTPGTGNTQASVTYKDALLCLLVDPQVLNNDTIILTVEVQKDAPGETINIGGGGTATAVDTRRVKTQVRIRNGETAVLGGIFEQELRNDSQKVPFFGDIPVLGNLFKNNLRADIKTELLIFLTPRILDDVVALQ